MLLILLYSQSKADDIRFAVAPAYRVLPDINAMLETATKSTTNISVALLIRVELPIVPPARLAKLVDGLGNTGFPTCLLKQIRPYSFSSAID